MAGNMGFAFTYDQRKELERQAMIYKHMISSVSVPPHLLFPFSRNSTASSIFDAKYSKNGDPEPGRCKRTDGKKWRCSRETAPHQKYCERHLHRGRPRSRKPVEVKNNDDNHKKTCRDQSKSVPAVTVSQQIGAANAPLLSFNAEADPSVSTASYKRDHRDLGLTLEGQMEHLMEAKMGLSNEAFSMQHQQQPLSFFPNSNFPSPEIGFIDAWSIDNMNTTDNTNVESWRSINESDLSTSLDLSMAQNFEVGHIQMKNNVEDYDHEHKTNDSMLLGPVSWEPFGGPLGEALQSGSLAFGSSSLDSPYSSISTPATTISSPSGVLHRTLFSDSPSFGGFDF